MTESDKILKEIDELMEKLEYLKEVVEMNAYLDKIPNIEGIIDGPLDFSMTDDYDFDGEGG
jgi:hypothetical protein